MDVCGRPPSGSWSGVLFTGVRDCPLKCVCVPVNFPVKDWFAPGNFSKRQASSGQFDSIAVDAQYGWEQTTVIVYSKIVKLATP
jgi:hypothetical protein